MNAPLRRIALGALLAGTAGTFGTARAAADDYWNGHWRWYDNAYRPYYQRQYYLAPNYHGNSRYYGPAPYYGNGYFYGPPAYNYPGGGGQIGPLRFGWW